MARSLLSDRLSTAITKMDEELQGTGLWENVELRRNVLSDALPSLLLRKIGLEKIMERVGRFLFLSSLLCRTIWADVVRLQVPENYLRAIFGSFLASRFIYTMGISASPVSFFAFMNQRMAKMQHAAS